MILGDGREALVDTDLCNEISQTSPLQFTTSILKRHHPVWGHNHRPQLQVSTKGWDAPTSHGSSVCMTVQALQTAQALTSLQVELCPFKFGLWENRNRWFQVQDTSIQILEKGLPRTFATLFGEHGVFRALYTGRQEKQYYYETDKKKLLCCAVVCNLFTLKTNTSVHICDALKFTR